MSEPDFRDVFISYASEDRKEVVEPLTKALRDHKFTYWLDEEELLWGDPLTAKISEWVRKSDFAVAVISVHSISKPWPTAELNIVLSIEASSANVRVLPLLVGGPKDRKRFREQLPFVAAKRSLTWTGDPTSIIKALKKRIMKLERASLSGLEDVDRIRASRRKLADEDFVIELLDDPIVLERGRSGVTITVDRRQVTKCIINNKGKLKVTRDLVKQDNIRALADKDREIQHFLTEGGAGRLILDPRELHLRLRWASGGVLSLVRFKGQVWVPLFFRDIPPYGWNISLGSTEREFDDHGQALSSGEAEHRQPWDFITREFLEESMVLNRPPDSDDARNQTAFRRFSADPPFPGPTAQTWRKYAAFRRQRDRLASQLDGKEIKVKQVSLRKRATLKILSNPRWGKPSEVDPSSMSNVLVCFSLRDLGIEVVRVFSYSLDDSDYLLDGELDHEGCLVRMPMALFSLDYLAEIFSRPENWDHYTTHKKAPPGAPPSVEVRRAPTAQEMVPFLWDIEQRVKIINSDAAASDHERSRFKVWYDMFRGNFLDQYDRASLANPSRLFVPGTAKILNLYFSTLSR